MRLERVSTAKNRFYITLDCDKRLKVQRLVLVAVMRVNGEFYVSEDAHFPPPSSKRGASPRLKGRAGPYETLLSFADSLHEDDSRSPRSNVVSGTSSPPVTGRRRASSLRSGSTNSSPRSTSSNDVSSWQSLVQWLLSSRHASGALILQHIAQLSSIAIDFGTHSLATTNPPGTTPPIITVEAIRQELLAWLEGGPLHIMDLLESGFLHQCIQEPWFMGNISQSGARAYLDWYCRRANLPSAFLVHFSSPGCRVPNATVQFPHLCIESIWTNEQTGALQHYSAPIVFEMDHSGQIYYWVETVNDAGPSRSSMLVDVVRYISNTTGWPSVWRNPPPQMSMANHHQNQMAGSMASSGYSSVASPSGMHLGGTIGAFGSPTPAMHASSTASSTIDGIAFHKPRSMPLLHSPSSRIALSSQSSPSNAHSRTAHTRSPMIVVPSRHGILPHDRSSGAADSQTDPSQSESSSSSQVSSNSKQFNFQPWAVGPQQTLARSQSSNSSAPATHMMNLDTTSSESAASSSVERDSAIGKRTSSSSAMQSDEQMREAYTPTSDASSFDMASSQDFDYQASSSVMNNPSQASGDHSGFPSLNFSNVNDSIGVRSLSAPTALRTWAAPSAPMTGYHGSIGDGTLSPSPYMGIHGAGMHPHGGSRFGIAPSVSFPYPDSHVPQDAANHFQFNPTMQSHHFNGSSTGTNPQ